MLRQAAGGSLAGAIIAAMPQFLHFLARRRAGLLSVVGLGAAAWLGGCNADARIAAREAARPQPVVTRPQPADAAPSTEVADAPAPAKDEPVGQPVAGLVGQVLSLIHI